LQKRPRPLRIHYHDNGSKASSQKQETDFAQVACESRRRGKFNSYANAIAIIGILEIITMTLEAKATMVTMIGKQMQSNNNGCNRGSKCREAIITMDVELFLIIFYFYEYE